ncbi:Sec-independent protein translocase protein TatB [Bartonella sp. B17]
MFGIDGSEFFVILLVLIVVVGPKDLPKMLKAMAKAMTYVRSAANEFRDQFDDAMRHVELNDLQKTLSDISNPNSHKELTEVFDPIHDTVRGIHDNLDVNITHHKPKKDKKILRCDQSETNEDLEVSVGYHSSDSVSIASKSKERVS